MRLFSSYQLKWLVASMFVALITISSPWLVSAQTAASNATLTVTRSSPGQYDNTRYTLTIGNHSGIGQYLVVTRNNILVTQRNPGDPGCLNAVYTGVLKLSPEDFPLTLTGFDCASASAVFRTEAVMPPLPNTPPPSQATLTVTRSSPGQYDNTRYTLAIGNHSGIGQYLVVTRNNVLVTQSSPGDPGCLNAVYTGILKLSPDDFPLTLTGFDCASASAVFRTEAVMPPEPFRIISSRVDTPTYDSMPIESHRDFYVSFNRPVQNVKHQVFQKSNNVLVSDYTYPSYLYRPDQTGFAAGGVTGLLPGTEYRYVISGQEIRTGETVSTEGTFTTASAPPPPVVKEQVKCVFANSNTMQKCYIASDDSQLSCSGIKSCTINVSGEKGTKQTWKSTCGGYAYTIIDGVDEFPEFKCSPASFQIISSEVDTPMSADSRYIESQRNFSATFNRPAEKVRYQVLQKSKPVDILIAADSYPNHLYQPNQTSFWTFGTVTGLSSGTEYRYVISGQDIQTGETASTEGTFTTAPAPPFKPNDVNEQVKCVFVGSNTVQTCHAIPDDSPFKCSGIGACVVNVSGEKGTKQTWKSSCGGYAYTMIDGVNKYAEFKCSDTSLTSSSTVQNLPAILNVEVMPKIDQVSITWETSRPTYRNVELIELNAPVWWSIGEGADTTIFQTSHQFNWGGLKSNTNYSYKITATDKNGLAATKEGNFTTMPPVPNTPPSPVVKEQVKCVFVNSNTTQSCHPISEWDSGPYSCSGIGSCTVNVSGEKGTKQTWKSSCGGYAYTMIDGVNEYAEFKCSELNSKSVDLLIPQKIVGDKELTLKQFKQSLRSFENFVNLVQVKIDRLEKAGIIIDLVLTTTIEQAKEIIATAKGATSDSEASSLAAKMYAVGATLNDALPRLDDLTRLSRALRLVNGRIRSAEQALKSATAVASRLKVDAAEETRSMMENLLDAKSALNAIKSGTADTDDVSAYFQEKVLDKLDDVTRTAQRIRLLGSIRQTVRQLDNETRRYEARIRREEAKGAKMAEAYELLGQLKTNLNELRPLSAQKFTSDSADNIIEYLQTIGDIKDQLDELLGIASTSPLELQLEQLFITPAPEKLTPFEVKQFDAFVSER